MSSHRWVFRSLSRLFLHLSFHRTSWMWENCVLENFSERYKLSKQTFSPQICINSYIAFVAAIPRRTRIYFGKLYLSNHWNTCNTSARVRVCILPAYILLLIVYGTFGFCSLSFSNTRNWIRFTYLDPFFTVCFSFIFMCSRNISEYITAHTHLFHRP